MRGGTVRVARALFERNREVGVSTSGPGTLGLQDVVVRDTQSADSAGTGGQGLIVKLGAMAEVARGLFERNRETGVVAEDERTSVRLEDTVVRDTLGRESDGRGGGA